LLLLLLCWGYIVAFTNILTIYQIHHSWIHPLSFLFILPFPIPGIVLTCLIFPLTYMCTHYFYHIYPLSPFPQLVVLWLVPIPQTGLLLSSF
jgi:hypothetical protein